MSGLQQSLPSTGFCVHTTSEHKCKLLCSRLYLNWCCAPPPTHTHLVQATHTACLQSSPGKPSSSQDPGPYQWLQSSCLLLKADPHTLLLPRTASDRGTAIRKVTELLILWYYFSSYIIFSTYLHIVVSCHLQAPQSLAFLLQEPPHPTPVTSIFILSAFTFPTDTIRTSSQNSIKGASPPGNKTQNVRANIIESHPQYMV